MDAGHLKAMAVDGEYLELYDQNNFRRNNVLAYERTMGGDTEMVRWNYD